MFFKTTTPNKIIFLLSWFLCFSIALPHTILPGKAGAISLLVFILWFFEGDLKLKIKILYNSKLFLSIVAFILVLLTSLLWTEQLNIGFVRISVFKYYLLLIPVLITSISNENALKLIQAFVLGNILHAILMLLLSYGVISSLPTKMNLFNPYSVYSPFFVFSSFYCFYYLMRNISNKNLLRALFYFSFALLFVYLIFENKGRSGQLAFIFSTIVSLVLLHKNWRNTAIFTVIIFAIIFTIGLSSNSVKSSYKAAKNDIAEIMQSKYHGSWGARWGLLVTNYEVIKKNPIIGVGLGDTQDAMQREIERGKNLSLYSVSSFDGSHNHYITVFTAAGILGFGLYILIHVLLFKLPIINIETKYLSLIFLSTLIANSLADDIILYKPYNIYFAIMIALFINLSLDKNIESDKAL